ncbi:hypothetical protein HID58_030690 [Brassica napus]|uniref:Sm domain-containing protein n=1 Tax=Brassica napus TaxID=3708 RepID=A0ABQ8CGN4_BRANA|nr:hypothetical protein HID58_030690 [Brassica napus]
MIECEDNWNCQLEDITFTAKDGKVSQLEHVFIRGSKVRCCSWSYLTFSSMLQCSCKRLDARIKAPATGRGTGGRGAVPPVRR